MIRTIHRKWVAFVSVLVLGMSGLEAPAASHLWRVNEIFSNADGTVQFIELKEACGAMSENFLDDKFVKCSVTGNVITFTANVPGSTANKYLLLGTAAFAALPGAPTPDYIIPAGFFSITGDTIAYHFSTTGIYQSCPFGAGTLPTNGTQSLNRVQGCNSNCPANAAVNSPTNYANQSGSVTAPSCIDLDMDGYGSPGNFGCLHGAALDCNDSALGVHPGATELCNDTLDNDCDSFTDCDDSGCTDDPACFVGPIPAVSAWSLMVLTASLLAGGAIVLARRRSSAVRVM